MENRIAHKAEDVFLSFDRVPIYHKIKFWLRDPHGRELAQDILDVTYCRPLYTPPPLRGKNKAKSRSQLPIPARFNTVLIDVGANGHPGVKGVDLLIQQFAYCLSLTIPNICSQDIVLPRFALFFGFLTVYSMNFFPPHICHATLHMWSGSNLSCFLIVIIVCTNSSVSCRTVCALRVSFLLPASVVLYTCFHSSALIFQMAGQPTRC